MSSAFPEWQGEEIVEKVPDFLGGEKPAVPPERERHRGRVPPKKSARNSASPKVVVDIQTFGAQAIEDDMASDDLCSPSPLTLELAARRTPAAAAAARGFESPQSSAATNSLRASPVPPRVRPAAAAAVVDNTTTATTAAATAASLATGPSAHPRPRPPQQQARAKASPATVPNTRSLALAAAPRTAPKANSLVTPGRSTPRANDAAVASQANSAAATATSSPTTAEAGKLVLPALVSASSPPAARKLPGKHATSTPSVGSLDDQRSSRGSSPSAAAPPSGAMPFSAPAMRSLPLGYRDIASTTTAVGAGAAPAGQSSGPPAVRASISAEEGVPQTARVAAQNSLGPQQPNPPPRRSSVPLPSTSQRPPAAAAVPPQPVSRTKLASRGPPIGLAVPLVIGTAPPQAPPGGGLSGSSGGRWAPQGSYSIGLSSAPSPLVPASRPQQQQQRPAGKGVAGGGSSHPSTNNTSESARYGVEESSLPASSSAGKQNGTAHDGPPTDVSVSDGLRGSGGYYRYGSELEGSEPEMRVTHRSARGGGAHAQASVMSSAGYSVLRGAYDTYATMDLGSTMASQTNLNATQNSVSATGGVARAPAARPPSFVRATGRPTMVRASGGSFAGGAGLRRPPQSSSVAASRDGAAPTTPERKGSGRQQGAGFRAAAVEAAAERSSTKPDEGHDKAEKHRKRAPQTKRELRRRGTDFETLEK